VCFFLNQLCFSPDIPHVSPQFPPNFLIFAFVPARYALCFPLLLSLSVSVLFFLFFFSPIFSPTKHKHKYNQMGLACSRHYYPVVLSKEDSNAVLVTPPEKSKTGKKDRTWRGLPISKQLTKQKYCCLMKKVCSLFLFPPFVLLLSPSLHSYLSDFSRFLYLDTRTSQSFPKSLLCNFLLYSFLS
jgi:hypothetical protein